MKSKKCIAMIAAVLAAESSCEKSPGAGKAAEGGHGSGSGSSVVDGIGQKKPVAVIDAGDANDAKVNRQPDRYPVRAVVNARGPQEEMPVVPVSGKRYAGPDCQVAYAPRRERDAAPMCLQPGGEFLMGAAPGEGPPESQPQQKVTLSPFLID
jgi:hypothetical protein